MGSCAKSKTLGLEVLDGRLALDGEGEMGKMASSSEKMGLGGTITGNVIDGGDCDGEDRTEDVDDGGGVLVRTGNGGGKVGRPATAPCV